MELHKHGKHHRRFPCPFAVLMFINFFVQLYYIRKFTESLETFIALGGKTEPKFKCSWMKKMQEKTNVTQEAAVQRVEYSYVENVSPREPTVNFTIQKDNNQMA